MTSDNSSEDSTKVNKNVESVGKEDGFFLSSSERKQRTYEKLRMDSVQLDKANEMKRKDIEDREKNNLDVNEKMSMDKDTLKAKIEEARKIKNDLMHRENMMMKESELRDKVNEKRESAMKIVFDLKVESFKREQKIRDSKKQTNDMRNTLAQLKIDNEAWKQISEEVSPDSNLWNVVIEQKKQKWNIEQKIREYRNQIEARMKKVHNNFFTINQYISQQMAFDDTGLEEKEISKQEMMEKEMAEKLGKLKMEDVSIRPNARKNNILCKYNLLFSSIN